MFQGLKLSPAEVRSGPSETYDQESGNGHRACVPEGCGEGSSVSSSFGPASFELSPEEIIINTRTRKRATIPQSHFRLQKGFFSGMTNSDNTVSGWSGDFFCQKRIIDE